MQSLIAVAYCHSVPDERGFRAMKAAVWRLMVDHFTQMALIQKLYFVIDVPIKIYTNIRVIYVTKAES